MTSIELKEKLDKALETVEKKKATIERHKTQAEKKLNVLRKNGWEIGIDDITYFRGDNYNFEALTAIADYEGKLDDIKEATKKLEEAEQVAKNWKEKLDKQIDFERKLATEIPEAFIQARNELIEKWVKNDIESRELMLENKKNLDYKEFRKLYKYTAERSLLHSDEEFRKIEEREADYWILDLYNRVKAITGEITDCNNLRWGGKCLNGYIVGKSGKARVYTIGAGGYNIQRYHLRVLIEKE